MLRVPVQDDLGARLQARAVLHVLCVDLEALACRALDDVLRGDADERGVEDPARDGVAAGGHGVRVGGGTEGDLLRPDPDEEPAAGRGGVRAAPGGQPELAAARGDDDLAARALDHLGLDEVGGAEEVGDEGGPRVLVQLGGGSELLDPAAVHHRDRVGHGHGLLLVVGDVDEGDADLRLDALELQLHLASQLEVEGTERLVEQQDLRVVDERAGDGDPLLLATGELVRLALGEVAELDELQHVVDLLLHGLDAAAAQPEGDVLVDAQVREERVALEDRVDGAFVRRQGGDVLVAETDGARRRVLESGDHPQRGGLSAAGGAEQGEERALRDGQVQRVDGREGAVGLADPGEADIAARLLVSHGSRSQVSGERGRVRRR